MLLQMAYSKFDLNRENNTFGLIWNSLDEGILCLFAVYTVVYYVIVPAYNFPRICRMPGGYDTKKRKVNQTEIHKSHEHVRSPAAGTRSKSKV